jgi:hypothetical protein
MTVKGSCSGNGSSGRVASAVNPVTGKSPPGSGYASSTVVHSETVLRRFYDFHLETGPVRWSTRSHCSAGRDG